MNPDKRKRAIAACDRKLKRLAMSLSDLSEALSYLDALSELDLPNSDHRQRVGLGLKSAAVVAYCRPFLKSHQGALKEAEGRILFKDVRANLTHADVELHLQAMALRCNVVAHSAHDVQRPKIVFGPNRTPGDFSYLATLTSTQVAAVDAARMHELAMVVRSTLAGRAGELANRLYELIHGKG